MDPTSAPVNPAELYELLGIIGGLVVSGLFGVLLVRRARAARQRMIDAVGEAGPPRLRGRERAVPKPEEEEEPEPEEAEGREAETETEAEAEAEAEAPAPEAPRPP